MVAGIALAVPAFASEIGVPTQSSYGWGRDTSQELCNYGPTGTNAQVQNGDQKVPVFGLGGSVKQMAGGDGFVLNLMANNTIRSCGKDSFNELGDGTGNGNGGQFYNTPRTASFPGGTTITQVAAGQDTGYALDSAGHVWSWGSRFLGQTGDGVVGSNCCDGGVPTPEIIGLSNIVQIASQGLFAMALDSDGHVWAWGNNDHGQLGRGTGGSAGDVSATPQMVQNHANTGALSGVISISVGRGAGVSGGEHALAVVAADFAHPENGGEVYAWGADGSGQLGDGGTANQTLPQVVPGQPFGTVPAHNAAKVVAGAGDSYVITTDHDVYAWGGDTNGVLGNGAAGASLTPVELSFTRPVIDLKASQDAAMALLDNETIATWGSTTGFAGAPSPVVQASPVAVTSIAMAFDTYLAVAKDPSALTVDPNTASVPKGLHQQMTATTYYADGDQADATGMVKWASDSGHVSVDQNGLATAVSQGSANVSATILGLTTSSAITVTAPIPDHLVLTPGTASMPIGESAMFKSVSEVLSDGSTTTPSSIAWGSSNSSAVGVNGSGLVSAHALGDSTITATADGVQGTALIHVATVTSMALIPAGTTTILRSEKATYKVLVTFDNTMQSGATNAVFDSSQPSVATIVNNQGYGIATAKGVGSTTISATLGGVTAFATLHVASINSITVTPAGPLHVAPGTAGQLKATANLSDGTTRDVTQVASWTSTNPGRVGVGQHGYAVAINPPGATIRATYNTVVGSVAVTVSHVTSIDVTPSFTAMNSGDTLQLTATGHLADGSVQNLTHFADWTSESPGNVDVDSNGLVSANFGSGDYHIYADFDGQEGSAIVELADEG